MSIGGGRCCSLVDALSFPPFFLTDDRAVGRAKGLRPYGLEILLGSSKINILLGPPVSRRYLVRLLLFEVFAWSGVLFLYITFIEKIHWWDALFFLRNTI
jgi:hypothetical protein